MALGKLGVGRLFAGEISQNFPCDPPFRTDLHTRDAITSTSNNLLLRKTIEHNNVSLRIWIWIKFDLFDEVHYISSSLSSSSSLTTCSSFNRSTTVVASL